uniref:Uncharacterized protein n=1 Tax=Anguilla anguilla TaxID=7936 RepID=A0A0E9RJZ0_ANGAN
MHRPLVSCDCELKSYSVLPIIFAHFH